MRIAYLTPAWPAATALNGIATYVDVMSRAIRERGHECVILPFKLIGDSSDPGVVPVHKIKPSLMGKLVMRARYNIEGDRTYESHYMAKAVAAAIVRAERQAPLDIVEMEESFGVARFAPSTTPVVVRSHGPHFLVEQRAFGAADRRRIREEGLGFSRANAASFPSQFQHARISEQYGLQFPNAACFPNPVEIAKPAEQWRLDECDRNLILFVGRFDLIKGADIMLSAFRQAAEKFSSLKLVMVGADTGLPDEQGRNVCYQDYVQANLPQSVIDRIDFKGPASFAEVAALRRRAFLCVNASRFETLPYSVVEALAMGAPVIASRTPGLTEYLSDGDDVLFTPAADASSLAATIETLLGDPHRAAQIGAAGLKTAISSFSQDVVVSKTLEFYQRVIEEMRDNRMSSR